MRSKRGSLDEKGLRYAESGSDEPGQMVYGPYITLPEGRYEATFWLKTDNTTIAEPIAILDVSAVEGKTMAIYAQSQISGVNFESGEEFQSFTLPFVVDERNRDKALEFRVYFTGKGNLWFKEVVVKRLGQ